jgi:ketosteroid isomerase-like protein
MPVPHVRIPVQGAREQHSRTLDQHISVKAPRLSRALFRRIRALPIDSALRRRMTARTVGLAFDAYNRRDFDSILAAYDPEVENQIHHVGSLDGTHAGHAGWRLYWRGWFEAWDESHQEVTEIVDFADDRLLILGSIRCRNNARGMELQEPFGMLLTIRDGRIVRHEEWFDPRAALRAAGLTEEAPAAASAGSGTG